MDLSLLLRENEERYEITLDSEQRDRTLLYLANIERWRQKVSITTISEPAEFLRFHFFEAFWAADQFLQGIDRIADVGSGTGFPGLALAIRRPTLKTTLIEPNQKKGLFLSDTARKLQLDCRVFCGKGEAFRQWPEQSLATLRALKPSPALLDLLSKHRVQLLHFRGRERDNLLEAWTILKEEKLPGSDNRWLTLYSCP